MLYHSSLPNFPKIKNLPTGIVNPSYSIHAQDEAVKDIYNIIILPCEIDMSEIEIFEVEIINDEIVKIAFRMEYDEIFDLCVAMNLDKKFTVKTVWLNEISDNHYTLDESKYDNRKVK